MKHLKKYKLFESVDLISLESTLNDIALELVDNGYKVSIDLIRPKVLAYYSKETETPVWKDGDPDGIRIEVSSPRKESLYSQWRQDRENFAKREYEKCKDVLDRLDTILISNGLTATIRNNVGVDSKGNFTASSLGFGSGGYSNLEHGECQQGFDYTGHWVFSIVYRDQSKRSKIK